MPAGTGTGPKAAFVTNARGIAPVGQIGDVVMTGGSAVMQTLTDAYESTGRDSI